MFDEDESEDLELNNEVSTGYEPRALQSVIHSQLRRFSVLALHRRFGKTVLAINHGIHVGLQVKLPNPQVSFISPLYKQSKNVAWQYLKDFTYRIPNMKSYESELKVVIPLPPIEGKPNVLTIQLFGADNPDSLRGMYHDFVIFDEYGNQPRSIWIEVVSPALADRKGGALFLGTPNGKNHFHDIYQQACNEMAAGNDNWYAATFPADETHVIDPDELEKQRLNMPEEEYRQEFLCDWTAATKGAFYSTNLSRAREEGRFMRIPYESSLPVFCAFDLGVDDYTACWFYQCYRNEIRLIRFEQWQNIGLLDILKEISQFHYVYATLYVPWDIGRRELSSAKSTLDIIEDLGFDVFTVPRDSLINGINRVREIFTQCYFDEVMCADGIDSLENYRKKVNPRTGEFLDTPVHDDFSHGADAFRYLAQSYDPYLGEQFLQNKQVSFMSRKHKVIRSV